MGDDDARVQRAARGGSPPSEGGQGAPPLPGGRMRVLTTSYTLSAAAGSNGLAHGQAIFRCSAIRTFATGCAPSVPYLLHPMGPKTGLVTFPWVGVVFGAVGA